jgi:hypothetical protein
MLAFVDDQSLARLFIAASAVPVHERSRWLQQLARKLDPTPNAIYSRRWAARQRAGLNLYHIELDAVAIEALLQREGLLPTNSECTREQVEQALTTFLGRLIELSER